MENSIFYLDPCQLNFPDVELAVKDPDGLLAVGGDLSVTRLTEAYHNGIFPWFNPGDPILWWSPSKRAILDLDNFYINRSTRKALKRSRYHITVNSAFTQVIQHCKTVPRADQQGSWITDKMQQAYCELHQAGTAHSIEVWQQQRLVAGLYGIVVGSMFCGESMFHMVDNGSKIA